MKYCSNCGNPIDEGNKFCTSCGKPVDNSISAELDKKDTEVKKPKKKKLLIGCGSFVLAIILLIVVISLISNINAKKQEKEIDNAYTTLTEYLDADDFDSAYSLYKEKLADSKYKYDSYGDNYDYIEYLHALIAYNDGYLSSACYSFSKVSNVANANTYISKIKEELSFLENERTYYVNAYCTFVMSYSCENDIPSVNLRIDGYDGSTYDIIKSKYSTGDEFYALVSTYDSSDTIFKGADYVLTPFDDGSILIVKAEGATYDTYNGVYE